MSDSKPLVLLVINYYKKFTMILAVISCVTLAIMMLSTTIDTTARYLFNKPIPGVFELNEVILVVCVFMGLAWCQVERGHIRITMLLVRLPPKIALILNILAWCIALCFVLIMAQQTWHDAQYAYSIKMFRWGRVQMPIWWARALVPFGLWLLAIQFILDIWQDVYKLIGILPTEISEIKTVKPE